MRLRRRNRGSSISEFGPALFIFFLIIFFPLIDILSMTALYGTCWYINFVITNQAARSRASQAQQIADDQKAAIMQTGLAAFLKVQAGDVTTAITFPPAAAGEQPTVVCTTTLTGQPFVTVPFFIDVPGLNKPLTFVVSSEQTRESTL